MSVYRPVQSAPRPIQHRAAFSAVMSLILPQRQLALSLDVITQVIEHLSIVRHAPSLLAIARTCKVLCGLALDALWSSVSTLVPLLKCLPDDVYRESDDGSWV